MEKYLSVGGETVTEKVIEKSRFITVSRHICGDEQAKAFVAEVSAAHLDATHNCYAYVADEVGNFMRFSDDGEPQGTAGMPMLEVLKNKRLVQTAVVVTRYFGGIKLGAGGLVRAYSGCVAENLSAAKIVCYEQCEECEITVDYPLASNASRYISAAGVILINSEYSSRVTFTVAVKKSGAEQFFGGLATALNGKAAVKKLREYFFPFEV